MFAIAEKIYERLLCAGDVDPLSSAVPVFDSIFILLNTVASFVGSPGFRLGPIWTYPGISGSIWAYPGISGSIWAYPDLSGPIRAYRSLLAILKNTS